MDNIDLPAAQGGRVENAASRPQPRKSVRDEVLGGDSYRLAAARHLFPLRRGGRQINPATLWRYIMDGCALPDGRVIRLEGLRLGKDWYTSGAAVRRFQHRICTMSAEAELYAAGIDDQVEAKKQTKE